MKIAVLSDSHKKFSLAKEAIERLIDKGARYIIHAGDICIYETLHYIKQTGLPYVIVYGNNDAHLVEYHTEFNLYKEPHYFKIEDIKFKLMHLPYYLTPDSDVVIYGHTHYFEAKMHQATLFLNPGEICARKKHLSESVLLEIKPSKFVVQYFAKEPKSGKITQREYSFER